MLTCTCTCYGHFYPIIPAHSYDDFKIGKIPAQSSVLRASCTIEGLQSLWILHTSLPLQHTVGINVLIQTLSWTGSILWLSGTPSGIIPDPFSTPAIIENGFVTSRLADVIKPQNHQSASKTRSESSIHGPPNGVPTSKINAFIMYSCKTYPPTSED